MSRTLGEKVFNVFNIILLSLFAFLCVYPFWYIIIISLNDGKDALKGGIYVWPRQFTLSNFDIIFKDARLFSSFKISVFKTLVGTVLTVIVNSLYAFTISKADIPGKKFLNYLILIPMYFGAGIVPYYVLIQKLGLINNIWVYIWPSLAAPFSIMMLRVHMKSIPASLEESAHIDGANYWVIFTKIILPLSLPALAMIALLTGISQWGDYLTGALMMSKQKLWPLQTLLLNILQGAEVSAGNSVNAIKGNYKKITTTGESIKMAMIVVSIAPILLLYPFMQKYFISGMMIGSVKE